jgi:hypothetical protein
MMELKDTVALMLSDKYEDRFIAEYCQLKIRHDKLDAFITKYCCGELAFKPKTPLSVFLSQRAEMSIYMETLENRAELEGITLPEV